jgi:hypothetical protein
MMQNKQRSDRVHQNMAAEGMPLGALWFSEYLDK